jgi:hypothetical protein
MSDRAREEGAPVRLRCLGGAEAPPEVVADAQRVLRLSAVAKQCLWEVLGPSLNEVPPPGMDELVAEFCRAYDVAEDDLGPAVRGCRFLLREASRADLSHLEFAEDVAAVSGGSVELGAILLAGYEGAKAHLRREILRGALGDHGKILEAITWRVDHVAASDRGQNLRIPVTLLTLRYREGDERGRVTLQLLPDAVRELKAACEKILA